MREFAVCMFIVLLFCQVYAAFSQEIPQPSCDIAGFMVLQVCSISKDVEHLSSYYLVYYDEIVLISSSQSAPSGCSLSTFKYNGRKIYVKGTPSEIANKRLAAQKLLAECAEDLK